MTLMTIEDFKARPCALEYFLLYGSCSAFIIMLSATYFGQVAGGWAISNSFLFAATASFLIYCKLKRQTRAKQFYIEWLRSLEAHEIEKLKHRVRDKSCEQIILQNLNQHNSTKQHSVA